MPVSPIIGPDDLFTVSRQPKFLFNSSAVGWQGAFFADLHAASAGVVDHQHERYCIQRTAVPFRQRELGQSGWHLAPTGSSLWRPGEEQRGEWQGGGACQFLFLSPTRADEIAGSRPLSSEFVSRQGRLTSPLVGLILDAMVGDLVEGSPAGPLVGDSLIVALFAHLTGAGNHRAGAAGLTRSSRQRVIEFIDMNLSRPMALSELAKVAGLGVRQFCRAFRTSVGESPHQYLLRQRIEYAKRLIVDGDALADVALHAGFSDQSQLTRTFKRQTGVSPAAYRAATCS